MIIIDHGEGWLSLYGQAESLLYREGQQVEAGEVIATAGRSGGARSAGLWFELRQDGAPQDPIRWCVARPLERLRHERDRHLCFLPRPPPSRPAPSLRKRAFSRPGAWRCRERLPHPAQA